MKINLFIPLGLLSVLILSVPCFSQVDLDPANQGIHDDIPGAAGDLIGPSVHLFQPLTGDYRFNLESNTFLWIPPVGFDLEQGKITANGYHDECATGDSRDYKPYPLNCLSSIVVETEQPYTATINIFDNTGKWIHSHVQKFGYCSELENANRRQPGGAVDFLVWNQVEDSRGTKVGSGVYVWKIVFAFEDGTKMVKSFKQGIAREDQGQLDPALCAIY